MIDGGQPFFLKSDGTSGVLLIHGFTGLPVELFLLGQALNRAGFNVLCPRLAGHGTNERDLMRTTRDDWFNSVLDGFFILRGVCDKIFVVGHSMGGLLTLKLSTEHAVKKIVTLAAPIFIDESRGLRNLPPREFCSDACIPTPRKRLADVLPEVNNVYDKKPLISVHELVDLIRRRQNVSPDSHHADFNHARRGRSYRSTALGSFHHG